MRAIIIEDEINAYEYLESIIHSVNNSIEIMAHIDSVEDAINWFEENEEPDVVFLDIQLSDGLSFEIFRHTQVSAPIIFTTAYDEYAIRAFKLNSIDYLLKPISKTDLEQAMEKLENFKGVGNKVNGELVNQLLNGLNKGNRNRFLVKKGNHYEYVNSGDIAFFHSEDSITFLHMHDGRRHMYSQSLADIEKDLSPEIFFQINRKQLVNINAVKKIHPFLNQRLKLEVQNDGGVEFIVSRHRATEFKLWVDR
jgi:DNA-binding LytR/AlgR family response regulator